MFECGFMITFHSNLTKKGQNSIKDKDDFYTIKIFQNNNISVSFYI